MPDRDYYLTDSPRFADLRTKYAPHIARMLKLAGFADAEARGDGDGALESAMRPCTPRARIGRCAQGQQ